MPQLGTAGPANDFRAHLPRFTGANLERNRLLADALAGLAREVHATPAQLATAWVLGKGEDIVPVIGARTRAQLRESLAAMELVLAPEHLARLERTVGSMPVAGTRYDAAQMPMLDSER